MNELTLRRELPSLFDSFFYPSSTFSLFGQRNYEVVDNEKSYDLTFSLPGHTNDSIKISIENSVLSVEAKIEKKEGKSTLIEDQAFRFSLPRNVDTKQVEASMKDGLLSISIPKAEEALPKKIEIKVS